MVIMIVSPTLFVHHHALLLLLLMRPSRQLDRVLGRSNTNTWNNYVDDRYEQSDRAIPRLMPWDHIVELPSMLIYQRSRWILLGRSMNLPLGIVVRTIVLPTLLYVWDASMEMKDSFVLLLLLSTLLPTLYYYYSTVNCHRTVHSLLLQSDFVATLLLLFFSHGTFFVH